MAFVSQMVSSSSTSVIVGLRSVDGGEVVGGGSWASVGLASGDIGALTGESGGDSGATGAGDSDGEAWTGGDGGAGVVPAL